MEERYVHTINGQEVRQADITLMSDDGALADDRVLWELIRTTQGSSTPDKVVIPWCNRSRTKIAGTSSNALVWGNTADALVHVMPFRAIVGSVTVIGASPTEHMRGQRSGYLVGTITLYRTLTIAPNATGNPRWTLIYAAVTPDADGATADVKVKSPTTSVVSTSTGLVVTKKSTVVLGMVNGTAAATPTRPSLPSDGAGTYYIALAYVFVPNGFGASSTVLAQRIHEVAPCPAITPAIGASSCVPADESFKNGGTVGTRQGEGLPDRPGAYVPSTMNGSEKVFFLLQFGFAPASHQDGDYVDRSRDWRYRYFRWEAVGRRGTTDVEAFATDFLFGGSDPVPGAGDPVEHGFGHSFRQGSGAPSGGYGPVMKLSGSATTKILGNAGGTVTLHVDATTGFLIVKTTGTVDSQIMIWLEATAPFSNFGTI